MEQNDFIVMTFAEAKQPVYREVKGDNGGYIKFGEKNDYPNYLLELFGKSPKHGAIVKGKALYICGKGWIESQDPNAPENKFIKHANKRETLNEVTKKVVTDIEIFGGAYVQVIWSKLGGFIAELYHIDNTKIRTNEDNTQFWYAKDWVKNGRNATPLKGFNPNDRTGKQILYIKEYRPGLDAYSLPGYISGLNMIEADIEVSKHILGNAQTGFSPSKHVAMMEEPANEKVKGVVEKKFKEKYTGPNGQKVLFSWVKDPAKKPQIDDLGASDLTKEDFTAINDLIQGEIFTSHLVTSPMLFGVKTAGQLGGSTELKTAYEIFKTTYVNEKQQSVEEVFSMLASYNGVTAKLKLQDLDPVSIQLTVEKIAESMTKDEIREMSGLPPAKKPELTQGQALNEALAALSPLVANKVLESLTADEIRSMAGLPAAPGGNQIPGTGTTPGTPQHGGSATEEMGAEPGINDSIKNLTAKQHQQVLRIIRQYGKEQITEATAKTLLKTGYGLSIEDINSLLGIEDEATKMSDDSLSIFDTFGTSRDDFDVLRSRSVSFESDEDLIFDEENKGTIAIKLAQTTFTDTEKQIIDLIAKDKLVTDEAIASALKISKSVVAKTIKKLASKGLLEISGDERSLSTEATEINLEPEVEMEIMYSYEGPEDSKNRPFCSKLLELNRLYSRKDIETMSAQLGYSVFDRRGGWYTVPGTTEHRPYCRHSWKSNVVIRK